VLGYLPDVLTGALLFFNGNFFLENFPVTGRYLSPFPGGKQPGKILPMSQTPSSVPLKPLLKFVICPALAGTPVALAVYFLAVIPAQQAGSAITTSTVAEEYNKVIEKGWGPERGLIFGFVPGLLVNKPAPVIGDPATFYPAHALVVAGH
jgi:hypothetical protein